MSPFDQPVCKNTNPKLMSWKAGESFYGFKYFKETCISEWSLEGFKSSVEGFSVTDPEGAYFCNIWFIRTTHYVGKYVENRCKEILNNVDRCNDMCGHLDPYDRNKVSDTPTNPTFSKDEGHLQPPRQTLTIMHIPIHVEHVYREINNGLRLKRNFFADRFLNTFRHVDDLDSFIGVIYEFNKYQVPGNKNRRHLMKMMNHIYDLLIRGQEVLTKVGMRQASIIQLFNF
ncbi:hypothetical protein BGX27_000784 [Mortierella sp. AM989]|nr:hypothetical protein BGX27_000784 [Mortierella sp. AM989]